MLENMYAKCLSCGWEGDALEGSAHDSDEHMVVYNQYEDADDTQAEIFEQDCGCL